MVLKHASGLIILTAYFGSIGIRKTGYTLAAALLADAAGVVASVHICRLFIS